MNIESLLRRACNHRGFAVFWSAGCGAQLIILWKSQYVFRKAHAGIADYGKLDGLDLFR